MVGATRTLDGFRGEVIVTAEPTVWYQPGTGRISQASGDHHLLEPKEGKEKRIAVLFRGLRVALSLFPDAARAAVGLSIGTPSRVSSDGALSFQKPCPPRTPSCSQATRMQPC